jgi:antitoxin CptB
MAEELLDARGLSRLRWRCRRGLLENDLLIERFFSRGAVTREHAAGLEALMALADNDLLDLFLGRTKPGSDLDRPEVHGVLHAVRESRTTTHPLPSTSRNSP